MNFISEVISAERWDIARTTQYISTHMGDPFEVTFYNAVIDGKKYEIFKANYGEVKWIKKL